MDLDARGKVRVYRNDPVRELSYIADMEERPPHYLRHWRKFRKMTQEELAEKVGTSKSVISALESDTQQLSPKWLRKIAPVLETSQGHILDHDPEALDNDIVDIWAHIPLESRSQAANVLRTFVRTGTHD